MFTTHRKISTMPFDPKYTHSFQSKNLTIPYNTLQRSIKKIKYWIEVSLTLGKEHHELRVHYIVTNTHSLAYHRRCGTFQDVLFSSA